MQPLFSPSVFSQERENEIQKLRTQVCSLGKIMFLKEGLSPLEIKGCNFFRFHLSRISRSHRHPVEN